jgi:hypothetical protein
VYCVIFLNPFFSRGKCVERRSLGGGEKRGSYISVTGCGWHDTGRDEADEGSRYYNNAIVAFCIYIQFVNVLFQVLPLCKHGLGAFGLLIVDALRKCFRFNMQMFP